MLDSPSVVAGGRGLVGQFLYRAGRWVAWALLRVLYPIRIEGAERVPRQGSLLVVANHTSNWDPMLLAIAVPRPLAYLAKEELFHPAPWGWALRAAGIIPVSRGRADRRALEIALWVLRAGGAVAVFAEGTRSPDGRLQQAEPGIGLIAARSAAAVLPVALLGTERLRSPDGWLRRPRLVARCGQLWQPTIQGRGGSAAHREIADEIMRRVAALMPDHRRGRYAAPPGA
jgi:1-acyl-sn-glycerol-3-phosphate acyltransferase